MTQGTEHEEPQAANGPRTEALVVVPKVEVAQAAVPEVPEVALDDSGDAPTITDSLEAAADSQVDDIEAAIAEANANLEVEPTEAEPVAEAEPAAESEPVAEPASARRIDSVSVWPFAVYDALWLVFSGVLIWKFQQLPADQAVFDSPLYGIAVLSGVALTAAGPVLALATWFVSWGREGASKGGLFVSALIKGAIATTAGVAMWWIALIVLDQLRLGRLL